MDIIETPGSEEVIKAELHAEISRLKQKIEILKADEKRRETIAHWSLELIVIFNKDHVCIECNEITSKVFGYCREELIGMHARDFVAPQSQETVAYNMSIGFSEPYEIWFVRKDGSHFWGKTQGYNTIYQDKPVRITTARDITVEKQQQAILARAHHMETIFNNGLFGMGVFTKDNFIHQVNQRALEILGYSSASELLGQSAEILHISNKAYQAFQESYATALIDQDFKPIELQLRRKDGSSAWVTLAVKPLKNNEVPELYGASVWFVTDISEEKTHKEKLIELATTDALTGINNRRNFITFCNKELANKKRYKHPVSLLMLDIDHFKKINDTYGHDVGDQTLVFFTQLCKKLLRKTDCFGRLGGEEFAILLPKTDISGAIELAKRICQATEQSSAKADSLGITITVSIGVSCALFDGETFQTLLKRADNCLYKAKELGRNRVVKAASLAEEVNLVNRDVIATDIPNLIFT